MPNPSPGSHTMNRVEITKYSIHCKKGRSISCGHKHQIRSGNTHAKLKIGIKFFPSQNMRRGNVKQACSRSFKEQHRPIILSFFRWLMNVYASTGEIIVGPPKALMMDEISTGLDSSTTHRIVKCLSQFCHILEDTIMISLLQPDPETFNLFDDVILLSEATSSTTGPANTSWSFSSPADSRVRSARASPTFSKR